MPSGSLRSKLGTFYIVCTVFASHTAFRQHERAMKGVWTHGGRFHRALLVVIESGTVYCLVLVGVSGSKLQNMHRVEHIIPGCHSHPDFGRQRLRCNRGHRHSSPSYCEFGPAEYYPLVSCLHFVYRASIPVSF